MTVKVGIISASWGAYAHLPAWRAVPGVEVTAICTSRRETAEAASARLGVPRAFWDALAMAADPAIDIIDIGTRPNLREAMVLTALRHGKHVYAGIPLAKDFVGARAIHAAWREAATVAVVDAFSQWIPPLAEAKRMLDARYVGRVLGGSCRYNMALFTNPDPTFAYNWFAEAGTKVSATRNPGSHLLHYLVHLLGPISEVVADEQLLVDLWEFPDGSAVPARNADYANVLLRFASGIVMPIQLSWIASEAEGWAVDLWGTEGRILSTAPIFPTSRDCRLLAGQSVGKTSHLADLKPVAIPRGLQADPAVTIDSNHDVQPAYPMSLAMHSMVQAIRGEGAAAPDFEQAWHVEQTLEAMRLSSERRCWMPIASG